MVRFDHHFGIEHLDTSDSCWKLHVYLCIALFCLGSDTFALGLCFWNRHAPAHPFHACDDPFYLMIFKDWFEGRGKESAHIFQKYWDNI